MAFLPALAVGLALLVEAVRAQPAVPQREEISNQTQRHIEPDLEGSGLAR
jgi:hypothetical protein